MFRAQRTPRGPFRRRAARRGGASGYAARVAALTGRFRELVAEAVPDAVPMGHPSTGCRDRVVRLPRHSGEAVLLELERREVVVSSRSACAAGSESLHVLTAIGLPEVAQTAVRFSFGAEPSADDIEAAGPGSRRRCRRCAVSCAER